MFWQILVQFFPLCIKSARCAKPQRFGDQIYFIGFYLGGLLKLRPTLNQDFLQMPREDKLGANTGLSKALQYFGSKVGSP